MYTMTNQNTSTKQLESGKDYTDSQKRDLIDKDGNKVEINPEQLGEQLKQQRIIRMKQVYDQTLQEMRRCRDQMKQKISEIEKVAVTEDQKKIEKEARKKGLKLFKKMKRRIRKEHMIE